MYTNELLEEKYKSQRELFEMSRKHSKDYFSIVEEEVNKLFVKMGWTLHFSKRKGDWLLPPKPISDNSFKNKIG